FLERDEGGHVAVLDGWELVLEQTPGAVEHGSADKDGGARAVVAGVQQPLERIGARASAGGEQPQPPRLAVEGPRQCLTSAEVVRGRARLLGQRRRLLASQDRDDGLAALRGAGRSHRVGWLRPWRRPRASSASRAGSLRLVLTYSRSVRA